MPEYTYSQHKGERSLFSHKDNVRNTVSQAHTHTHTHTHSLSLSHTHTRTYAYTLTHTHTHTHVVRTAKQHSTNGVRCNDGVPLF